MLQAHPLALLAAQILAGMLGLIVLYVITRAILGRVIGSATRLDFQRRGDAIVGQRVIARLTHVVLGLFIYHGAALLPWIPSDMQPTIRRIATSYVAIALVAALAAVLDSIGRVYQRQHAQRARLRPIKSYLQMAKILAWAIAAIFVAAALFDRDPLLILSGLGALTAVLMLIFKDTIQSFVAGVQLATHDMLRVGDWIEMPQVHADGVAIDLSLHTVKVQNTDHSITTIPTWRLINESFRNWRGMFDAGARLIQRALYLDQTSVYFLEASDWDSLGRFGLIDTHLARVRAQLLRIDGCDPGSIRRATNASVFRAYVSAYLSTHPEVRHDLRTRVRQLQPGPTGLPLEIDCFTSTDPDRFDSVQAEIVEHLLAILPEFGLRIFQQPNGAGAQPPATGNREEIAAICGTR